MITYTPQTYLSAATTNATAVKTTPCKLGFLAVSNVNAAARYLKVFNKASAPTVGTDTPVLNICIPGGGAAGAFTNVPIPLGGLNFSLGLSFALSTGSPLLDNNAVAANEIAINIGVQ